MLSKNIFMVGITIFLALSLVSNVLALNDSQLLQVCYSDDTGELMILCSGTDEELGPPIGTYPTEEEVPGGGGGGLKPPVHQLFEKVVGKEISVSTYQVILWSLIGIVLGILIWLFFFIRKRKKEKEEE